MEIASFRRLLTAFADESADVDVRRGRAVAQIRDELIDVEISISGDDSRQLIVTENGQAYAARAWLLNRVARLPQLADRIVTYVNGVGRTSDIPFVRPSGLLSPDLSSSQPDERPVADAVSTLLDFATDPIPGATSVLYLTSDAGEGKTTVINRIALMQAQRFKSKQASSLIVPIPLSGRAFLTFDDAVIAALVNKLRFNYLYFEAFLALVRMGSIVPAFDGYEEMLVEGSKGEAVSALGSLVQTLESEGTVIIAARKAFFDYLSFRSQAKLLDAIGNHSASFSRLALRRWTKEQFLDYGLQRGVADAEAVYETVEGRLGADHPLLTRAVLVRRLFDVAATAADREDLARLLGANPHDYFYTFVDAIVQREASEKWLARISGEMMEPLLTAAEHHELLSQIALEMWQSSSRSLKLDVLDVLVDIYAESRKKSGIVTRQIKERIKQHSLLSSSEGRGSALSFDHEDFQDFFLGEGLGRTLASGTKSELYSLLAVGVLSSVTVEQSVQYLARVGADVQTTAERLKELNAGESGFSFCKENCGLIVMRICEMLSGKEVLQLYKSMYFSADSLLEKNLKSVRFEGCHFQPTGTRNSLFDGVEFFECEFERIDIDATSVLAGASFIECRVTSVLVFPQEEHLFDPAKVDARLVNQGGTVKVQARAQEAQPDPGDDERLTLLNRFLRIFMRTTHVNEDVIRLRLGSTVAQRFIDDVLPSLIDRGVLAEVTWDGRGVQRRYRLTVPMAEISRALEGSGGSFDRFLTMLA